MLEASQNLEINFANPLTATQFSATLSCNGSPVFFASYMPGSRTMQVQANQKPPGATCDLVLTSPVQQDVRFTVAPAPVPTPLRVVTKAQEPYRYGFLEHPFPFSLGDIKCNGPGGFGGVCTIQPDSLTRIGYLCQSGAGNARIDYDANDIETVNGLGKSEAAAPNFQKEDLILNALLQCGVTELPDVLQYDGGAINAGGKGQSAMLVDPAFYGKFAGDVAAHLKAFPQVTMIQLMNEPNDHGWGTCPTGPATNPWATSDESGACVAKYLLAGYAAIKAANPNLIVVGPALSDGGHHTDFRKFIPVLLANGCGTGKCWDVIDIHNYAWFSPLYSPKQENTWDDYKAVEALVPNTPIMLTEAGWCQSDVNFNNQFCMSEAAAAQYYAIAANLMLADPNVIGVTWVNLYNGGADFWGRTSFLNPDGSPKAGYHVICTFTGAC